MTLDGRLFMQVRPASYDAEAVVGALRVCSYARFRGQDRPHLGWLAHPPGEGAQRLSAAEERPNGRHLEQLPGYAPDLNPDEGIWNYLKRVELGNVCCSDFDQLYREIIRAKERLRHKKGIIISCARQCGYLV